MRCVSGLVGIALPTIVKQQTVRIAMRTVTPDFVRSPVSQQGQAPQKSQSDASQTLGLQARDGASWSPLKGLFNAGVPPELPPNAQQSPAAHSHNCGWRTQRATRFRRDALSGALRC